MSSGLLYHCLAPNELERFLERRRAEPLLPPEFNLAENLIEILRKANQFVPSSAGSILLDDPQLKRGERKEHLLTFIAAFGEKADGLVGQTISAEVGIAGFVYRNGTTYMTSDAPSDPLFFAGMDRKTDYRTLSIVAIPIRIEQRVCGVLELINRRRSREFSLHDRTLLEIFADYISISIQNVLDGRQAQEIAKKDNLTGLFNDRYLHVALSHAVARCRAEDQDLAVLFIDLDFFKRVNDTHGHLAGSQVLREVGGLLRKLAAQPGVIPTRYGGDEFVLVIPDCDLEAAVDLAEEIRTSILTHHFIAEPGDVHPEALNLSGQTCSIGVATLSQHISDDMEVERIKSTLLRLADSAMYVAKETGRNRTAVAGAPIRRRRLGDGP